MVFLRRRWRSSRSSWPPKPTVEDEVDALSHEVIKTPKYAVSDSGDDVQSRGSIDQTPIILDVDPPITTPSATDTSSQFSSTPSLRTESSSETLEPKTPADESNDSQDLRYVWKPEPNIGIPISYDDPASSKSRTSKRHGNRGRSPSLHINTSIDPEISHVGNLRLREPSPYSISKPDKAIRFSTESLLSPDTPRQRSSRSEKRRPDSAVVESLPRSDDSSDSDHRRRRHRHSHSLSTEKQYPPLKSDELDLRRFAAASELRKQADHHALVSERASEKSTRHGHRKARSSPKSSPREERSDPLESRLKDTPRPTMWNKTKHSSFLKSERPVLTTNRHSYESSPVTVHQDFDTSSLNRPSSFVYSEERHRSSVAPSLTDLPEKYVEARFELPHDDEPPSGYSTPKASPRDSPSTSPALLDTPLREESSRRSATLPISKSRSEHSPKDNKLASSNPLITLIDHGFQRSWRAETSPPEYYTKHTIASAPLEHRISIPSSRIESRHPSPAPTSRTSSRTNSLSSDDGHSHHHHHHRRVSSRGMPLQSPLTQQSTRVPSTSSPTPPTSSDEKSFSSSTYLPDARDLRVREINRELHTNAHSRPYNTQPLVPTHRPQLPPKSPSYSSDENYVVRYRPVGLQMTTSTSPKYQTTSCDYVTGYPTPPSSADQLSRHTSSTSIPTQQQEILPSKPLMISDLPKMPQKACDTPSALAQTNADGYFASHHTPPMHYSVSVYTHNEPEQEVYSKRLPSGPVTPTVVTPGRSEGPSQSLVPYGTTSISEPIQKTPSSSLPPCPRANWASDEYDWLTLPGIPNFDVCPSCYEHLAAAGFRHDFVPSPLRPRGYESRCQFSLPWIRMAWLQTLNYRRPNLDLIYAIATNFVSCPPCPGRHADCRTWYRIPDPDNGLLVPNFDVCSSCIGNIEILMPSLRGAFRPCQHLVGQERTCDLRTDSNRFATYIDLLEAAALEARATRRPPNLRHFANAARKIASIRECPRDDMLPNAVWYLAPSIPTLTICEECYDNFIFPDVNTPIGSLITGTPHLVRDTASCQMYSEKMRKIWTDAVKENDVELLRTASKKRWGVQKWLDDKKRDTMERENEERMLYRLGDERRLGGRVGCIEEGY
ncbi:MAG: hypothetical protein M1834_007859 [Cirrosporium novae-zelandiae]|nr:MAG: hypothetical protein M1834_007859 [Cirrosporium novae-zelandiae]